MADRIRELVERVILSLPARLEFPDGETIHPRPSFAQEIWMATHGNFNTEQLHKNLALRYQMFVGEEPSAILHADLQ